MNQTEEEKEQNSARLEVNCQKQCLGNGLICLSSANMDWEGLMIRNAVNHHQGQAFCFITKHKVQQRLMGNVAVTAVRAEHKLEF